MSREQREIERLRRLLAVVCKTQGQLSDIVSLSEEYLNADGSCVSAASEMGRIKKLEKAVDFLINRTLSAEDKERLHQKVGE